MEEKLREKAYDRLQKIIKEGGDCNKKQVKVQRKDGKEYCRKKPKKGAERKKNPWDEFRKEMKMMGTHSNEQLKDAYKELKMKHKNEMEKLENIHKEEELKLGEALIGGIVVGGKASSAKALVIKKKEGGKMPNAWIQFLQHHKGKGYSREQLKEMYHKENKGGLISLLA